MATLNVSRDPLSSQSNHDLIYHSLNNHPPPPKYAPSADLIVSLNQSSPPPPHPNHHHPNQFPYRQPVSVGLNASPNLPSSPSPLPSTPILLQSPTPAQQLQLQQQQQQQQLLSKNQPLISSTATLSTSLNQLQNTPELSKLSQNKPGLVTNPYPTRKTSSRYALADFDLIRTLGTGSFGRVHLAKSRHNGRGYAIKVLNKQKVVTLKQVEHTNSEREMLATVRHPFLVNLWGTFADSYNLYMVMDFVSGGELFNLLRKSQRFPDPVAKFFGAEVALALDYLHCLDIVYRDLKPENILLGSDGHIKITDFGFAKLVPDITWTLCGTPDYLAPEIVQSKGYNKSVDWYALGVLIFEMLAGYPPFYCEEESPMRLYEKIIAGKVRYPSYFNSSSKDLLKSLLTADLSKRFGNLANGSRDIFHHAWFAEVDWERLYRKQIPAPYVPSVTSEWDASNFDHYDEASLENYGKRGSDPYGSLFPHF
ncbi:kinase-like domain-containing protein [Phakopsora pachyrhizi]|nr:kinase-like domain-containing protein [Phakopsora pachyrhizi]